MEEVTGKKEGRAEGREGDNRTGHVWFAVASGVRASAALDHP